MKFTTELSRFVANSLQIKRHFDIHCNSLLRWTNTKEVRIEHKEPRTAEFKELQD